MLVAFPKRLMEKVVHKYQSLKRLKNNRERDDPIYIESKVLGKFTDMLSKDDVKRGHVNTVSKTSL